MSQGVVKVIAQGPTGPAGAGSGSTIPVTQGGTGATTAAGARTNLGAEAAGAAASAVASHAGGTGVHTIAGVTGLQTALDAKEASGTASTAVAAHAGAGDPHGDRAYAAAQDAAHVAAADPHPGYRLESDTTDAITEGSNNLYFSAARVRAAVLTGLSTATNAVIDAADTVLGALGKLQAQIAANLATLTGHTGNTSNPHSTTAAQVGAATSGAVTGSGLTMATARLLGRSTASTGAVEEISVGSGLSLSGGTLSASGGGGGASGVAGLVQISDGAGAHTSDSDFVFDATNNRLTVGSGSTTSRGVQIGYMGTSGWGGICQTGVTPSVGTEGLAFNGNRTILAGSASSELYVANSLQLKAAGSGVIEPGGNNYALGTASLRWQTRASSLTFGVAAKTADYTIVNSDLAITSDATGGARTNTLPALSGTIAGQIHIVIKTDSSGNAVSLDANGSETINGSTSAISTSTQWGVLRVMANADKSGWITW